MNTDPSTRAQTQFAPTRWTLVLRARGDSPEAQLALGDLCAAYWTPVFRFLRREGRDEETARELTQEFFARLLARGQLDNVDPARGRFRSFLLGAVKHFLADQRAHQHRQKRGSGMVPESIDATASNETDVGLQLPDPAGTPSDAVFDRDWALTVMDHALATLGSEFVADGKREQFDVLKAWLAGDTAGTSQAEAALRLGLSEAAVKVAVHRLRKRFREIVKKEISETVSDPAAVQEELRYLIEVLSRG